MKKKCFAVYMLIIIVALLSLPFAFGNWSQSVHISGYIKTAEIELKSKEDQNVNKSTDKDGEDDYEDTTDLDDSEADKSEQDPAQDKKDDGGIDSGEQPGTSDERDEVDLIPADALIQAPVILEDAPASVEENYTEAEPESNSSPELQQKTTEDGMSENPAENPSNQGGVSAEIDTEGDEIPAGAEAVPGDNKPTESGSDSSPVDDEDTKTDSSQEYEAGTKTAPET